MSWKRNIVKRAKSIQQSRSCYRRKNGKTNFCRFQSTGFWKRNNQYSENEFSWLCRKSQVSSVHRLMFKAIRRVSNPFCTTFKILNWTFSLIPSMIWGWRKMKENKRSWNLSQKWNLAIAVRSINLKRKRSSLINSWKRLRLNPLASSKRAAN